MAARLQSESKALPVRSFTPVPTGLLQRKCACGNHMPGGEECGDCQKKRTNLQRKPVESGRTSEVPSIVHEVLRTPGQALDTASRAFFESRFGRDFSYVRIHADAKAAESARAVDALAYTVGNDIAFDTGQYTPHSSHGRQLLAHELAHVVQQNRPTRHDSMALRLDDPGGSLETEARMAELGNTAIFNRATPGIIHRKNKSGNTASGFCGGKWSCATGTDCTVADNAIIGPMPPSTWWKLTVMIDTEAPTPGDVREDSFGHTYVKFRESNGNIFTYGFYPNPTTIPNIFRTKVFGCIVHPDKTHESCVDYKEELNLSEPEYDQALGSAQTLCKGPPNYDLFSWNCTTFADFIAKQAGKSLPSIRGKVGGAVTADNPNTLLEGLKTRDAARVKAGGSSVP